MKKQELTKQELEIIDYCLFRRQVTLEEAGLTDSRCYPIIVSARNKLKKHLQ